MSSVFVIIYGAEIIVDWIKHMFITKFNRHEAEIYGQFLRILRADTLRDFNNSPDGEQPLLLQSSFHVTKRLGFVPLPISCLLARIVYPFIPMRSAGGVLILVLIMINCGILKLLIRFHIIGLSVKHIMSLSGTSSSSASHIAAAAEERPPQKVQVNVSTVRYEMTGAKVV
eukprot:TRINITY_DN1714_c2_g1_i2.p2 TRINITY_DN1714_c2_g1~~TRINITY_DN1714_c2_g1_i2.p2  ORF type:complete len:171 (+),score=19.11 TRINITY_DN1714_c2_g1_i2:512-1024(+)